MRLLLDTHALLWWLNDDEKLGDRVRRLIVDHENDVLVSVVSLWEITVKLRIGKVDADIDEIIGILPAQGFGRLEITDMHLMTLWKPRFIIAIPSITCSWLRPLLRAHILFRRTSTCRSTVFRF